MLKIVFTFAVLLVIAVQSNPLQSRPTSTSEVVTIIQLEEPCVRQGGLCSRMEDCEPGNRVHVQAVLCPMQRHLGIVCCYI